MTRVLYYAGKWVYGEKKGLAVPVLFSLEAMLLVYMKAHIEQP